MASKYKKRCPSPVTSDCVEWVGENIPCLEICTGDLLTEVETAIATKLCEIVDTVDLSTVTIPECIKVAWDSQDPTILNFIQFLLDLHCSQQVLIEALGDNIANVNPIFTLEYPCCNTECPGLTGTTLSMQQHLQKIILCMCEMTDRIDTLEEALTVVGTTANNTQAALTTFINGSFATLVTNVTTLTTTVNNLQTTVDACCG